MTLFSRFVRYCSLLWLATLLSGGIPEATAQETPENAAIRDFNVAAALQNSGLYPRAADKWKAFIQKYNSDSRLDRAHYHLGVCQLHTKKYPEAVQSFQTVLSKYPQYSAVDGAQYNLAMAKFQIALASNRPEDFKAAAAEFGNAAGKYPQSKYAANALYYQGESLYSAADLRGAVTAYKTVVDKHRNSGLLGEAYYALGTTQQELGLNADAAATYKAFLADASFANHELANQIRLRHGIVLLEEKKYDEAEKLFAAVAAVADCPNADYALLGQGQCRMALDKKAEAAALFAELIRRFPESSYKSAAQLAAGKAYFLTDKLEDAQRAFQPLAATKTNESAEAAYWLGRTLVALKKPQEAVAALDTAIKTHQASEFLPSLQLARVDALYDLPERRKETAALYEAFAKSHPTHAQVPRALYMAGLAALGEGDYPAAQRHTQAFLAKAELANHELTPGVLYIAAESHLLAAQGEQSGGDPAKAEAFYRQLVRDHATHPRVARANLRIGWCLHAAKKYDDAVNHLNGSLGSLKDPTHTAEAQLLIGRSQAAAGRDKEAVAAYDAALKAKGDWVRGDEVLLAAAASLRTLDDKAGAAERLGRLISSYKQSELMPQALYQLGDILYEQEKYDEAIAKYSEVIKGFAGSEFAGPSNYGLAAAHFAKKDYNAALAPLGTLMASKSPADLIARGRYLRGLVHQRMKQHQPAVDDFQAFLASKPEGDEAFDARYAMLLCQIGLNQFGPATAGLESLLKDKPDYALADKVYYELGHAMLAQDKLKEAAVPFAALAEKFPDSTLAAESWFHVGRAREKAEDIAKAAEAYAAGLAKAKPDEAELREKLQYKLGDMQFRQEKYAEATAALQAQVKEYPAGELIGPGRFLLAESLFRENKYDQSLPLFTAVAAAKVEQYHAMSLYQAGRCASNMKNWPECQKHFQELIAAFPKFNQLAEARYGLGLALQQQKKLAEARTVYEQVTRDTESETAAKARFMIGEIAFAERKFEDAVEHFLTVSTGYPYKEMQAKAQLEAGRCFIELKDKAKAAATLKVLVEKFPDAPEAQHAAKLIASLK